MGRKSEFSGEEKIAAVRLVTDGGRTVLSVANEYGLHEDTVLKWKRQYRTNPEMAFSGQNGETPPDEAERMKRRIRELEKAFTARPDARRDRTSVKMLDQPCRR